METKSELYFLDAQQTREDEVGGWGRATDQRMGCAHDSGRKGRPICSMQLYANCITFSYLWSAFKIACNKHFHAFKLLTGFE